MGNNVIYEYVLTKTGGNEAYWVDLEHINGVKLADVKGEMFQGWGVAMNQSPYSNRASVSSRMLKPGEITLLFDVGVGVSREEGYENLLEALSDANVFANNAGTLKLVKHNKADKEYPFENDLEVECEVIEFSEPRNEAPEKTYATLTLQKFGAWEKTEETSIYRFADGQYTEEEIEADMIDMTARTKTQLEMPFVFSLEWYFAKNPTETSYILSIWNRNNKIELEINDQTPLSTERIVKSIEIDTRTMKVKATNCTAIIRKIQGGTWKLYRGDNSIGLVVYDMRGPSQSVISNHTTGWGITGKMSVKYKELYL